MIPNRFSSPLLSILFLSCAVAVAVGQQADQSNENQRAREREGAQQRAEALQTVTRRLGVGLGATIADIGAGNGRDS
jgi:hypothetical protein